MKKCLSNDNMGVYVRGLCWNCYERLRKQVKAGKTTWDILAIQGRALPAMSPKDRWKGAYR